MQESTYRKRDITIKILTGIITIVFLIIGLRQYSLDNRRSYINVFYDNQFKLYEELLDITSELAITPWDSLAVSNKALFPKAKKDFLKFYYGKLILVEDQSVEMKMVEMKNLLAKFEDDDKDRIDVTMGKVQEKVIELSLACRESLENTREIKLEVLKREE